MDYNVLMSIIFDVKTFSPTLMWTWMQTCSKTVIILLGYKLMYVTKHMITEGVNK